MPRRGGGAVCTPPPYHPDASLAHPAWQPVAAEGRKVLQGGRRPQGQLQGVVLAPAAAAVAAAAAAATAPLAPHPPQLCQHLGLPAHTTACWPGGDLERCKDSNTT